MHKLILGLLCCSLLFILVACKTNKNSSADSDNATKNSAIKKMAQERFGDDYLLDYNETKEYVLIKKLQKVKPSDLTPTIRFEVVELKSMESQFSDAVAEGEVVWEESYIVRATSYSGIPDPEGNSGKNVYRYHAKNKKKYSGGFFNKKN